jgi:Uma2 family endonuclease
MSAVFMPARMRITIDRYQKMVAAGVLTPSDRVELIEGDIVSMAPIGTRHAGISGRLLRGLFPLDLNKEAIVRAANPVDLGDLSEPEPDVIVLKPRSDDYMTGHPRAEDVLLLIEVADTSLAFDRGPMRDLYARYGIREYWVVDVNGERVFTYREPSQGVFHATSEVSRGETVSPESFPVIQIAVTDLFV